MKIFLLFLVVVCMLASNANAFEPKWYVGMDVGGAKVGLSDGIDDQFAEDYILTSLNLGVKTQYCGLEFFTQASSEEEGGLVQNRFTGMIGTMQANFFAYGIDAIGYLPITGKFDLLGTIGMGIYNVETEGLGLSFSEMGTGSRFGLGAEYNITDNFSLRAISRYVILNIDGLVDVADSLSEFTLGVKYSF